MIDAQKRWKNGQAPHRTTGVARTNSIQLRVPPGIGSFSASPNIAISRTGKESAALTQNRSRMELYSGSASTSAKASIGSRAMPQIGQEPGPSWTISGCIGQVYRASSFAVPTGSGTGETFARGLPGPAFGADSIPAATDIAKNFSGSFSNLWAQRCEQK